MIIPELGLLNIIGFLEVRLCKIHYCTIESNLAFPRLYWKSYNVFTRAAEIEMQTRLRTILFVQQMHMRGCHAFCVRMHHTEKNKTYNGS